MNSPFPQHTHHAVLNVQAIHLKYMCKNTLAHSVAWVSLCSSVKTSVRTSISCPSDVWKVEGNQSHFLHFGCSWLWFPPATGATLALKYRLALRVWEVDRVLHAAKNNRGNCCSKPPTTGRDKKKGGPSTQLQFSLQEVTYFHLLW